LGVRQFGRQSGDGDGESVEVGVAEACVLGSALVIGVGEGGLTLS
jgi:hypothetical protein